jgi:hypothetical protein
MTALGVGLVHGQQWLEPVRFHHAATVLLVHGHHSSVLHQFLLVLTVSWVLGPRFQVLPYFRNALIVKQVRSIMLLSVLLAFPVLGPLLALIIAPSATGVHGRQ